MCDNIIFRNNTRPFGYQGQSRFNNQPGNEAAQATPVTATSMET